MTCILIIGVAGVLPARAATLRDVQLRNNLFDPASTHAISGDTIRWTVTEGSHNVETYGGSAAFASSMMSQASVPYEQTYGGGVVLYRCRPHSTITSSGNCVGMCGTISDTVAAPAVPDIVRPAPGSSNESTVTFTGTGDAWTTVRLTEQGSALAEAGVDGNGAWAVSVRLANGTHTVAATGFNVDGVSSAGSDSVTFTVGAANPDTMKPTVRITSDGVSAGRGSVRIDGLAFDDVAVASVTVLATDLTGAPRGQWTATCSGCPSASTSWTAQVIIGPGIYRVVAVARDTATPANVSDRSGSVLIVVA